MNKLLTGVLILGIIGWLYSEYKRPLNITISIDNVYEDADVLDVPFSKNGAVYG